MIITCPNCSTQFSLNADQLGDAGRYVRCAKCAHRWFAEPDSLIEEPVRGAVLQQTVPQQSALPSDEPAVEAEASVPLLAQEVSDEDGEAVASPPPIPSEEEIARFQTTPPAMKKSTVMWWIFLLVVIVLVVGSLFVFRRDIVAFYPPTQKLYTVLGYGADVLGSGLEIPEYAIVSRQEGNKLILAINGEIKNTTSHVLDVPLLFGTIRDSKGKNLHIWSFRAEEPRVLAGESVAFETEAPDLPRIGVNVSITFTTEAQMEAKQAMAKSTPRTN